MQPHTMFGMLHEEPEEEDDGFDLSGWMSRDSYVSDMAAAVNAPSIEEPPVRPRASKNNGAYDANAQQGATFTSEPLGTPQHLGYSPSFVQKQSPFNPLYAHDESVPSPTVAVAAKSLGLLTAVGSTLYIVGKGMQYRSDKMKLSDAIRNELEYSGGFGSKLALVGLLAYLEPSLGWKHGALASKMPTNWLGTVGTVGIHALLVGGTIYYLKRG